MTASVADRRTRVGEAHDSGGGVILVGVQDDGTVAGRRLDQASEDQIHEAASSGRDLGRYAIRKVVVGDKDVIGLEVRRREEGFAQTRGGRVLVRRGGRNTAVYGGGLARFIQDRSLRRFELTPAGVPVEDASRASVVEVSDAYGWDRNDSTPGWSSADSRPPTHRRRRAPSHRSGPIARPGEGRHRGAPPP